VTTIRDALRLGNRVLLRREALGVDTPQLDADILLRHATGMSREKLLIHLGDALDEDVFTAYCQFISRRAAGEPVAYITKTKEFFGLTFHVDQHVLIPRPDTEVLVQAAIKALPQGALVADVGTGSGAIAVTVAHHRPDCSVVATDRSLDALRVAQSNARHHGVNDRVFGVQADLLSACAPRLDAVVANLPYIPTGDISRLLATVRSFEPHAALVGGHDGLGLYRRLLDNVMHYQRGVRLLLCEIGVDQAPRLIAEITRRWPATTIVTHDDLAHMPRAIQALLPPRNAVH